MTLFRPFGQKLLGDLTRADLDQLVSDDVREGLFVEYKRDWTPEKFARAVASFANTHGGTLIGGVEADKLLPTKVVGIDHGGDLNESVVNAVRARLAPIPSFTPATVDVGDGRACLIVEVPEGTQTPYLLVGTGQILVRTPTSSEPVGANDREAIDRLFLKGERGQRWALARAGSLAPDLKSAPWNAELWTVPAVEDGLAVGARIFRQSFIEKLAEVASGWWIDEWAEPHFTTAQRLAQVSFMLPVVSHAGSTTPAHAAAAIRVHIDGVVQSLWLEREWGEGIGRLELMAKEMLPRHRVVMDEMLGHRGPVAVSLFDRWKMGGQQRSVRIVRPPVPLEQISEDSFIDSLTREMRRALGRRVYEPEEAPREGDDE